MLNPETHFIESIRTLRAWCLETFGIMPSLRVSKALVEELREEKRRNAKMAIEDIIKEFGENEVRRVLDNLRSKRLGYAIQESQR